MLLAHDIGTTGDKATLFDTEGRMLASAFASYPMHCPRPGQAEQNPEDWWNAVCATTRQILAQVPKSAEQLLGVGFSAMMNGALLVDEDGKVVRPCLIHADIRSQTQCERIAHEVGEEQAYLRTGNRIAPYFTLGKLAYLIEHEPENIRKARWCVQAKEYLIGRLTGVWGVTDASDASLTGCYDLSRGAWDEELIAAGGFPKSLLPEVRPSISVVGAVTPEASAATGLRVGLPVVLGGGDGACATAGAAAVRSGDAYHYLGGTSWVAALTDSYRPDPTRRVSVFCGLEPGTFVVYGTVQSAGSSVDWLSQILNADFETLEQLAESAPPSSRGLFFLPYIAGERSPIWDANARGVFFGLSAAHGRAELARAVFEGVAFALGSNLAVLEELGLAPRSVRVLGGGMRSLLWRRIFAAVYNRPLHLLERLSEATSCGAAMATAVALELYPDLASAAPHFAPLADEEPPDPPTAEIYARASALFRTFYPALAESFAALAQFTDDQRPTTNDALPPGYVAPGE